MAYEFKITRKVEFYETDMAGIVHFSNYFRYMETVETAFMRSLSASVAWSRKGQVLGLPRVHAECQYQAPLRFEDEVLIHLLVEKKGRRSVTYQIRFYCVSGSTRRQVAVGRVVAVCAMRQKDGSMKAVALPKVLADKIQAAPAHLLAGQTRKSGHGLAAPTPGKTTNPTLIL